MEERKYYSEGWLYFKIVNIWHNQNFTGFKLCHYFNYSCKIYKGEKKKKRKEKKIKSKI